MASSDPMRPSTGQSFAEMSSGVTDLSHLADGFPSFNSSESGGNTVTDTPAFGSAGVKSEASAGHDVWTTTTLPAGATHVDTSNNKIGSDGK